MKFGLGIGLWLFAGCQGETLPSGEPHSGQSPSLSAGFGEPFVLETVPEESGASDLFEPRLDTSEGLINSSFDLLEVLEFIK